MYKIMFSDLDETLLVNHHVPSFNREAISKAREKGVKFVPCTGRSYDMVTDILDEIGTRDKEGEYSLCFNGGLIIENKNDKVLHFKGMSFEQTKIIFENARDLDVCILVFTLGCCYIFNANEDEVQRKTAQKAIFEVVDGFDIDFLKDKQIAKVLYERKDMDYLKHIATLLPDSIKDNCTIAFSSGRYLEMNTKGVDKGYGMKWLANYLGVDISETIGIGDNYNDVEMIKTAGLGCAVTCAQDDIKAIADYVTELDYDQGGVKEVIERFILDE